jgi:hypothetical protein
LRYPKKLKPAAIRQNLLRNVTTQKGVVLPMMMMMMMMSGVKNGTQTDQLELEYLWDKL